MFSLMQITVNNQLKEIQENSSLQDLLTELKHTQDGIAIAINQNIITKIDWQQTQLSSGDNILIIQATQGG